MVGFDPLAKRRLTKIDYTIASALSGAGTRCLCQPADVLKIRFQLQYEPTDRGHISPGKYTGLWQATKLIVREEGAKAFWKGHIPAQALSIIYGTVKFQTFEFLTKEVWNTLPSKFTMDWWSSISYFICGSLAACTATVASYPFDVIRTRLVGQGEPKTYRNILHGARLMYEHEKIRGFYKGLWPTLLQVAPNAGFQFGFYKLFTRSWAYIVKKENQNEHFKTGILESFVCGAAAGTTAKTLTYPLDLMKKRLQIHGFEKARVKFGTFERYDGLIHGFETLLKKEGFKAMFKGWTPSVMKALCSSGLTFLFYEQTCNFLLNMRR